MNWRTWALAICVSAIVAAIAYALQRPFEAYFGTLASMPPEKRLPMTIALAGGAFLFGVIGGQVLTRLALLSRRVRDWLDQ